jgi:hypothetical protein
MTSLSDGEVHLFAKRSDSGDGGTLFSFTIFDSEVCCLHFWILNLRKSHTSIYCEFSLHLMIKRKYPITRPTFKNCVFRARLCTFTTERNNIKYRPTHYRLLNNRFCTITHLSVCVYTLIHSNNF